MSRLACAMRLDNGIGEGLHDVDTLLSKMKRRIDRNCSIKEVAIKKQLYNILISKMPSGWNSLVMRLADFGAESVLIPDSFEFFKLKLEKVQPHLRMSFVKTIANR